MDIATAVSRVLTIGTLLIGVYAVYTFVRFVWALRTAAAADRELDELPVTPVSQIKAGGTVKVRSIVWVAEEALVEPILGNSCVASLSQVVRNLTEWERRSRSTVYLGGPAAEDKQSVDFLLDDGTGRVRVSGELNLRGCENTLAKNDPATEAYLNSKGVKLGESTFTASISMLCEGMEVTVVGTAQSNTRAGGELQDRECAQIGPRRDGRVVIFVTNMPLITDMSEWDGEPTQGTSLAS